ncbi:MAG: ABC transporter permease [Proteobacteria bacterium]|jgi:macrolide transport system ATP-binding/permease protein|nr:ABC transporter permease [Pseudomonadota bacterium]
MSLIEIKNLSKVYKIGENETLKALDDVSLKVEYGEYVSIIGPSGSGKSTLLQIMGLLDLPSSGWYQFMGQETTNLDDDALTTFRSQNIGFIFQMFNLLPRVSVEENTVLPVVYRGVDIDPEHTHDVLKKLGLDKHKLHTPAQLSGGQQQRVAIARSLINKPKIIFADEPTGNLPQKQAHEIISELEALNAEGMTLFVITHDPTIAERAHRVIRIVDGKIVSDERKVPLKSSSNHLQETNEMSVGKKWNAKLWLETFKIALQSMARNKVRTFLTMLGIIIGVFSVISMLAIGEGAKKDMEYSLRQMGSNMFRIVSSRPTPKGGGLQRVKYFQLSWDDYEALKSLGKRSGVLESVSPVVVGPVTITYGGKSWSSNVEGVAKEYEAMRNYYPSSGRFFNQSEDENQELVCLIGQTVYQNLFGKGSNPIGQVVKINMKSFRVIGLLPVKGSNWGKDEDDTILMPVNTAMKKLLGMKKLSFIFAQAKSEDVLDAAIEEANDLLRQQHQIKGNQESDFKIKNFGEIKKTIEEITGTMTKFIGIVALISLLVGGIGIMNIMLVSVTERTREIGVRKAIGARRKDILLQFLIESMMIGLVGGLIGVGVALLAGVVMTYVMNWEVAFKFHFILLSFLFSLGVGIFFGIYPARKASKLSPIHALRYE